MPDSDERSNSDSGEQQKKDVPLPAPEVDDPVAPKTELESVFETLELDKDHELFEKILGQYELIKQQGIMEPPAKHWLACCLYTNVWSVTTVGNKPPLQFSTMSLLDSVGLSIMEFMDKLEKWAVMINAQARLLNHIETVEGNLSVSIIVFNKYITLFRDCFVPDKEIFLVDPTSQKQQVLNTFEIFSYIWLSYLGFKKQLVKTREKEDLMNSFHLLLVITDLVIADLIDQGFEQFLKKEFLNEVQSKKKSILDFFCESYNGVSLDCKHFRTHWFLQQAQSFAEDGFLKMNLEKQSEFLDHIFYNSDFFHRMYEDAITERFEIDERIFCMKVTPEMLFDESTDFSKIAVTVGLRPIPDGSLSKDAEVLMKKAVDASIHKVNVTRNLLTPLSGKAYLTNTDICFSVGSDSGEVDRSTHLVHLLNAIDPDIAEEFSNLLAKFPTALSQSLSDKVVNLNALFVNRVKEEQLQNPDFDSAFAKSVDEHGIQINDLFRRFLHRLTLSDYSKKEGNPAKVFESLCTVLQRDDFINSLYVCAVEIFMFSYNSQREFPWSVQVVNIAPITFYKVIEPVIRCDPELTRDMQKHLNRIEERVLEELGWSFESPIWKTIGSENPFPYYDEVMIPEGKNDQRSIPIITPNPSANVFSRFGPPTPKPTMTAKRRLDFDPEESEPSPKKFIKTGGSSSLTIFARKVYYLAALHLNDLCDRLRLEEKGRRKVWTLFEHILRNETTLMRGRHLDQNLMCCLYIIARVNNIQIPFHEILYHYRHQPQAASRIYRHVLIATQNNGNTDDSASRDSVSSHSHTSGNNTVAAMRSGSTMPAPGMTSAPPTPEPQNAEYHDLIYYYNRVFVRRVEDFVKRLAFGDETNERINLLPVPTVKCNTLSPRKMISPNVCVVPLSTGNPPQSPSRPLRYNVNRSPSKDLHHINAVIRQAGQSTFRIAPYHPGI
ncbi:hypothetical protein FO519_001322 [Halicephalobus sp. NKZ332]|nr:hypothetical protein FO519_001322 [Halicephalobus sp. NKZ332]